MFRSMPNTAFPSSNHASAAKTVYLETFGCQMNELDSELVCGHLKALGYRFTPFSDQADVILYNTCLPFGTSLSGEKSPARGVSYSRR